MKPKIVPASTGIHRAPSSPPTTDDTETASDRSELARSWLHQYASHVNHDGHEKSAVDRSSTDMSYDNMSLREQGYHRTQPSRHGQLPVNKERTILITNIAARTTHKDIVGVIRGGSLLDVHFRDAHSVCVTFYEGAAEFLFYAKRNDIYIHGKRVSVGRVFIVQDSC